MEKGLCRRVGDDGNQSPAAAESFRQFLAIKAKADAGDRMVEDAKKRAGQ